MYKTLAEAAANCTRNLNAGLHGANPALKAKHSCPQPVFAADAGVAVADAANREDELRQLLEIMTYGDCRERVRAASHLAQMALEISRSPAAHSGQHILDAIVGSLVDALENSDWVARLAAITALGEIGPPAHAAVPVLTEALEREDLCISAAIALGRIGPEARQAIDKLHLLREKTSGFERWCAEEALRVITQ